VGWLRSSSWRTRSSPIAERASHSAFAWEISPRSKTTGFNPSGDMLSRGIGLIHPIIFGSAACEERQQGNTGVFGWSTAFIASKAYPNACAFHGARIAGGRPLKPDGRHLDRDSQESTTQLIFHPTFWLRPGSRSQLLWECGSCHLSLGRPPTFTGSEKSEIVKQLPSYRPS